MSLYPLFPFTAAAVMMVLAPGLALGKVIKAPLSAESYDVGPLYPPAEQPISVSVVDGREDVSLIGGGIVGPKGEAGKGIMLLYTSERDEEVQQLLDTATQQAVSILGFTVGSGGLSYQLELTDSWIDMYRFSGFSPMNCLGYLGITSTLKNAAGEEIVKRSFRLGYFENTNPVGSMKEVSREAVSRILLQAAWETTARTLIEGLNLKADPVRLEALGGKIATIEDEVPARQATFWLGLAGKGDAGATRHLRALLAIDEQRVHTAAAEALGLAEAIEAKPELEALLGGAQRGAWDPTDLEHVWYLAKGLHLLGEPDVKAKLPTKELDPISKLNDLLHFLKTGKAPQLSDAERVKMAKELPKVAKKRKG